MDCYMYQAALYCEDCGRGIIDDLTKQGEAPEEPEDKGSYDSDDFPKGPIPDGGGEADCPQHCDSCALFLENDLTSDGVTYVEDAMIAHVVSGRGDSDVLDTWAEAYGDQLDWERIGREVWKQR